MRVGAVRVVQRRRKEVNGFEKYSAGNDSHGIIGNFHIWKSKRSYIGNFTQFCLIKGFSVALNVGGRERGT